MDAFQPGQQAYALGVGTTSTSNVVIYKRDPNANDINFPIPTFWQNTVGESIWYLNSFSSTSGELQADWITIKAALNSLSDTANTPVTASSGLAIPPNNIQLTSNNSSLVILSNPTNHSIDLSVVGGGKPIEKIDTDEGISPVEPDASGVISIQGQDNPGVSGIRVAGGIHLLDISMESPFQGDFSFIGTVAGAPRYVSIVNSSNTAASDSKILMTVAGTSAGNPFTEYVITSGATWSAGVDNADSDSYKISSSSSLASNERFSITTSGAIQFNNVYTFPTADGVAGQALVTDGSGNISFGGSSGFSAYTNVASSPYTVLASDQYLSVNTGSARTINMPNTTTTGRIVRVKDRTGTCASNNITITTPGGVVTFDGSTSYVININYGEAAFIFNGTNYEVF